MVKILLVSSLLQRRLWAYPTAIVIFGAFLGYQLYRYSHTHSAWLLALTVFDLLLVILASLEYQRLRLLVRPKELPHA